MTRKLPWEINKTPPAKLQRVPQTPRPKPDRASSPDAEERTVGEEAPHERGRQQQKTPKAGPGCELQGTTTKKTKLILYREITFSTSAASTSLVLRVSDIDPFREIVLTERQAYARRI